MNDEIPHVRAASKVSLTELDEDMSQLRNNLKDVEREIEFQQLQPVVLGDKFLSVMKEFLFIASSKFSNLENFFRDMNTKVSILLIYYNFTKYFDDITFNSLMEPFDYSEKIVLTHNPTNFLVYSLSS